MQKLTDEQALIISGATGVLCCNFEVLHADIEKRFGRPIWTHQLGNKEFSEEVKAAYKADLLRIIPDGVRK